MIAGGGCSHRCPIDTPSCVRAGACASACVGEGVRVRAARPPQERFLLASSFAVAFLLPPIVCWQSTDADAVMLANVLEYFIPVAHPHAQSCALARVRARN